MKAQVLPTLWCNISGESAEELWHWSLQGCLFFDRLCGGFRRRPGQVGGLGRGTQTAALDRSLHACDFLRIHDLQRADQLLLRDHVADRGAADWRVLPQRQDPDAAAVPLRRARDGDRHGLRAPVHDIPDSLPVQTGNVVPKQVMW